MKRITIIMKKTPINRKRVEKSYRHVFGRPMDARFYGSKIEIHVPDNQQLDNRLVKKFARRLGRYSKLTQGSKLFYKDNVKTFDEYYIVEF